jgi:peptidoglycan hydrolase-like protein with peptidoglycan-binding domain
MVKFVEKTVRWKGSVNLSGCKLAFEMAKKRKAPVDEGFSANPLAVVQWGTASIMALLIVYNAFLGQGAGAPPGATTHVAGGAPETSAKTITIRYDAKIEEAQRQLLATGHYRGLVDGIVGARTKDAVVAYQREHGLQQTGSVDNALLDHIRYLRKVAQAAEQGAETTSSTAGVASKSDKQDQTQPAGDAKIMRLQKLLVTLGYDAGKADGKLNAETRKAIRQFEADHDLQQTGNFSENLLKQVVAARSSAANDQ